MSAVMKALSVLGLTVVTALVVPDTAQADDGRFDWLESRIDRAENRRDRSTDHGELDVIEDRIDRAEDRGDAAGNDRYQFIDDRERYTWRRYHRNDGGAD
jgi:hypothetical protein